MKNITVKKSWMIVFLFAGLSSFSQSLTPLVIGMVHPNDSVVIYYDVIIGAGAGSQISNQGTVTGTGINIVTDDPDTAPANDPTITLLNMFPLPVGLMDLKASLKGTAIEVAWNVTSETGMVKYEVEKSTNGRTFDKIGGVTALNRSSLTSYSFIDGSPATGANLYRLKLIAQSAAIKYSVIIRIDMDGKNGSINIYPNPVLLQNFTLQLSNMPKGNYELLVYNVIGQIGFRKTIYHDGGSATKNIMLPTSLPKGTYSIQLRTDKQLFSRLIILQ